MRRQAIAEAGAAVLEESGIEGLTHRAVADRARVPLGSTSYYFTSRDDLLAAAVEHVAAESLRWLHEWAKENAGRDIQETLPQMVYTYLVDYRDKAILDVELYILAARRPRLQDCVRKWAEEFVEILTNFVDRDLAELLAASVNGYSLINVATAPPASVDDVRRILAPAFAG